MARNSPVKAWLQPCRGIVAAGWIALACGAALAQVGPPLPDPDRTRSELENLSRVIEVSAERREKLAAEIAQVKKDHASITAALIQSAKTERKLAQDIEDIAGKVEGLKEQETGIRTSLNMRRGVLAEVLGALQRMGLNPPPAILVKPEDALSSIRSAILLGAVVPELRSETEILMADLKELSRVVASIEAERDRLTTAMTAQAGEKARLDLLLEAKNRLRSESETALAEETKKSIELAARAESLKDLIASLDKQAAKQAADAEAARKAAEAAAKAANEPVVPVVPEANQLVASAPFSLLQGQLALPVAGRIKRRFGADDGIGGTMLGDMVATQSGAIVTAPADGSVLYAGPFRSYGQLLILNAGDGYHVVLAGMSRISVAPGQSVLAGEPIGAMGEARVASTSASENANATPELYVEFRKDGKPVDPTPWWADRTSGRT
ncbi:septal ring factor EnvC (AmiA/AmiB activator) [Aminobacter aminovorans]|uniref:Septal ring factor n=1 Tax=Aminobacter aminovorans TaxID=83263 RepID=A0A380WIE6_AMIAI|nr:murein hydrolase activator EnvC [Aminobacter aminovorans]TCS27007.1 septal ring factor EnvC (AmiA/AmiB activator) [Aminobacter aminovorans]SUU87934.1 Septal ring factor [Aminobacter aminovorans]